MFCRRENSSSDHRRSSTHKRKHKLNTPPPTIGTSKAVNYHKNIKQTLQCIALLGSVRFNQANVVDILSYLFLCDAHKYPSCSVSFLVLSASFSHSVFCVRLYSSDPCDLHGVYMWFLFLFFDGVVVVPVCLIFIATIPMKHKLLCSFPLPTNI